MRKLSLIFILLPLVAFASISSDINSIFDWFYTGEDNTEAFDPSFDYEKDSPNYEIPDLFVPENPTMEDLVSFRKQVFTEESLLQEIESELRIAEQGESNTSASAADIENELFLLEGQKDEFESKLKEMEQNIAFTEKKITNLTREKQKLRASFAIAQEDFERFMTKRYVRKNYFGGSRGLNAFRWLFSDQNASDLLEEEKRELGKEAEKEYFLQSLWGIKSKIDQKEKEMAFQFARFNRFQKDLKFRYGHLEEMTDDREKEMRNLFSSKRDREQTIQTLQGQQAETTLHLQSLRTALEKIQSKIALNNPDALNVNIDTTTFIWPFEGEVQVTASYHDTEYEEKLGRIHEGVDFALGQGSSIRAVADGVVENVENGGYGYSFVSIKHAGSGEESGGDVFSLYGHLSKILVTEGQNVLQGERIGESGGTPGTQGAGYWTTGAHLHFAVYNNRGFINPSDFLPQVE